VELASGLVVPAWVAETKRRPLAVDLFSGAGGMSLGMIQGGFEVVAALDNEAAAAATYMNNLGAYPCEFHFIEPADGERLENWLSKSIFGRKADGKIREGFVSGGNRAALGDFPGVGHFFFGDARKLKGKDILRAIGIERGELDCVCGGPPCQGFTFAGKRQVHDPRNSLVFEFARLVVEMLPKTLVFENVPGILHMVTPQGIPVMDQFCRILEDGGFAGVDALHQTLAAQSGSVGMLRGKSPSRKKPTKPAPKKAAARVQRSLKFG
jgi:DNA (cytosine-5)-methyltransferase 1